MYRDHPEASPPRRPGRACAAVRLTTLLVAESAALGVLVSLGRRPPFDLPPDLHAWADAEPTDALAAALRWVALGAAGWLFVATLASVGWAVASRHGPHRRHALLAGVVPRALRHLAEQAVLGGLALGVAAVPAAAQASTRPNPPVVTVVRDGRATDLASLPGVDPTTEDAPPVATITSTAPVAAIPGVSVAAASPGVPAPALPGRERVVVVAPGEHLWELAAREVARARGVPRDAIADAAVAPYWLAVRDANRGRLASGDVNLVFVGETVVLPAFG